MAGNGGGNNRENSTREGVLSLIQQKDEVENNIRQMNDVLQQNGVGMNDPLVDAEGFPRSDIDVYQVRHARHQIRCLQNDHKTLMKQIENGIHSLHAQQREGIGMSTPPRGSLDMSSFAAATANAIPGSIARPFLEVNMVTPYSPADEAGLKEGDLIIQFGSVHAGNFRNLQDMSTVVQLSQNRPLSMKVRRGGHTIGITLVPRPWGGRGLLGCNIVPVPFDTVDR